MLRDEDEEDFRINPLRDRINVRPVFAYDLTCGTNSKGLKAFAANQQKKHWIYRKSFIKEFAVIRFRLDVVPFS